MEERRLGPVVGLGTWRTFGGDAGTAAGSPPWLGSEERARVAELAA